MQGLEPQRRVKVGCTWAYSHTEPPPLSGLVNPRISHLLRPTSFQAVMTKIIVPKSPGSLSGREFFQGLEATVKSFNDVYIGVQQNAPDLRLRKETAHAL